jgi:cysteine-rich repeat protein
VISAHDSVSGALAQVDSFAITVTYGLCGDSIVAPNEQCDDGNTNNGDCCSSTCQFESSGSACSDGNACTTGDTCNGTGTCNPGAPTVCDDGDPCTQDSCNTNSGCAFTSAPRLGCRTAGKALLLLKSNVTTSKDKLVWKWLKGQATTFSDFGNLGTPTGTTAYTLCVYSGTSEALAVTIPDSSTKWHILGANKGYKYKDPSGAADGIQKALLKAGAAGKAKAQLKGKGTNLPGVTLPFTAPVTAQLVNSENSICYTTGFATFKKNTSSQFKAKSP